MNTTEILMQYVAGQMAQSYFPQVNNNASQSGQSDFQTMLKDKQNQSQNTVQQDKPTSSEKQEVPQKEQSTQQTTQDGQQMQQLQQMQQMQQVQQVLSGQLLMGDAALASGQVQPMQQMMQNMANSVNGESQMAVATTVAATVDTQNAVPQQVVQPMAQAEGDATQGEGFQLPQQQVDQAQATQQTANTVQTSMETAMKDTQQMAEGQQTNAPMQDTDVTVETAPQNVQQPLFSETENMPVKVGDAPVLDTTVQPEEFDAKLNKIITDAANQNMQRVELRLNPENLGNVVVELTRSPEGILHVVLHADNQNAAKLLSEHSANLGLMLQNSNATEVRVEVPQSQQSQQPWQQPDQNDGQQQQQQQQQPRQQQQNAEDFLHQIRLGLLGMEVEQA